MPSILPCLSTTQNHSNIWLLTLPTTDLSTISDAVNSSQLDCKQVLSEQRWLPLAMTDAALFHSILCGTALYRDLRTRGRESVEKVNHMKEAVQLLSARLQDPEPELSDSTILAVAHLAEFEASSSVVYQ